VNGVWQVDSSAPTEIDANGIENNVLSVEDLAKLPVVPATQSTKEETIAEVPVESVAETKEPEKPTVVEQLKESLAEVTAPITGVAVSVAAAVTGIVSTEGDVEPSPTIPGKFPLTPVEVPPEGSSKTEETSVPVVQEPAPVVVEETKREEPIPPETTVTDPATAETFEAALEADRVTNTAPAPPIAVHAHEEKTPEAKDTFTILPIPSETAPKGTKPLAKSVYKEELPESTTTEDTTAQEFKAALEADKVVNSPPIAVPPVVSEGVPAEPSDSFSILPIPSATAPEGTKPLSESVLKTEDVPVEPVITAKDDFESALEADKLANTAPLVPPSEISETGEPKHTFTILPVPSETAPAGTQPLAPTVYKEKKSIEPIAPEPVTQKEVPPVEESKFEPVTSETNIISSTETPVEAVEPAPMEVIEETDTVKEVALETSDHAAQAAAKVLSDDAPGSGVLDATEALSGLTTGGGVTAIGTAVDTETGETGLSHLVALKTEDVVEVESQTLAPPVEAGVVLDDTKLQEQAVETVGSTGHSAVASTPMKVTVPTEEGVQEVTALGTAIATDGTENVESLKTELLDTGDGTLPEGVLAHLPKTDEPTPVEPIPPVEPSPPSPPAKEPPSTARKTPVTQSSASKKENRLSAAPSESSQKKKGGFLRRLRKVFS
jgi:hypothetical protein